MGNSPVLGNAIVSGVVEALQGRLPPGWVGSGLAHLIRATCLPTRSCWMRSTAGRPAYAVIVVGAQAVYLHTGTIDLGVPEFTLDADITLDPALLREIPEIEAAMLGAHFVHGNRVGVCIASRIVSGTPPMWKWT